MYQLSKEQVKMFVRVMMPILYSMKDAAGFYNALDCNKPVEQQHQMGHSHDSPRIARLKERAAMAESAARSSAEIEDRKSGREVEYESSQNRSRVSR